MDGEATFNLPKNSDAVGVWVRHGKGDVHNYIMGDAVVIGTNVNYQDNIQFSDMALIASKKDGLSFQYATENGEPEIIAVSEDTFKAAILGMLTTLKEKAIKFGTPKKL